MRSYTCYECGHQFQVAYGFGGPGSQMACPNVGVRTSIALRATEVSPGAAAGGAA